LGKQELQEYRLFHSYRRFQLMKTRLFILKPDYPNKVQSSLGLPFPACRQKKSITSVEHQPLIRGAEPFSTTHKRYNSNQIVRPDPAAYDFPNPEKARLSLSGAGPSK
jgi:hypothetical protein